MKVYFMINGDKMVLILDKNEAKSVFFPKNIPDNTLPDDVTVELIIRSELSNDSIALDPEDYQYGSNITYEFNLQDTLPYLDDGEYHWEIVGVSGDEGDIHLGEGLLRLGNLKYSPKQANNKTKKIIQYGE